jgi:hypothetical protein
MLHKLLGKCHCHNLSFELSTRTPVTEIEARACDCRFCRIHAARNWSDPDGEVIIRIGDVKLTQEYRFGLHTADFLICRACGAYLGAVLSDKGGKWSTINLRLTDLGVGEMTASYGCETASDRIARRKRVWTPTKIIRGA